MSLCIMIIMIINRNDYALKRERFYYALDNYRRWHTGTAITQKLLSSGLTTDRLTIIDPHETFAKGLTHIQIE